MMATMIDQTRQHRVRQQVHTAQGQEDPTQVAQLVVLAILAQQKSTRMYTATFTETLEDTTVVTSMLSVGFVPG